jgi:hypothetical protein
MSRPAGRNLFDQFEIKSAQHAERRTGGFGKSRTLDLDAAPWR